MKLMLYFLFYTVIILIFWLSYISYTLAKLHPDHLNAYAAALGAFAGVLMIAVQLLPMIHKGGNDDMSDAGDGE